MYFGIYFNAFSYQYLDMFVFITAICFLYVFYYIFHYYTMHKNVASLVFKAIKMQLYRIKNGFRFSKIYWNM